MQPVADPIHSFTMKIYHRRIMEYRSRNDRIRTVVYSFSIYLEIPVISQLYHALDPHSQFFYRGIGICMCVRAYNERMQRRNGKTAKQKERCGPRSSGMRSTLWGIAVPRQRALGQQRDPVQLGATGAPLDHRQLRLTPGPFGLASTPRSLTQWRAEDPFCTDPRRYRRVFGKFLKNRSEFFFFFSVFWARRAMKIDGSVIIGFWAGRRRPTNYFRVALCLFLVFFFS